MTFQYLAFHPRSPSRRFGRMMCFLNFKYSHTSCVFLTTEYKLNENINSLYKKYSAAYFDLLLRRFMSPSNSFCFSWQLSIEPCNMNLVWIKIPSENEILYVYSLLYGIGSLPTFLINFLSSDYFFFSGFLPNFAWLFYFNQTIVFILFLSIFKVSTQPGMTPLNLSNMAYLYKRWLLKVLTYLSLYCSCRQSAWYDVN